MIVMTKRLAGLALAAILAVGSLAACGRDDDGTLSVVTSVYPLEYLAKRIGGDAVTVRNLAKPGAEPHDLELSPRQVATIADADLVVYLKGFQPAVDDAVAEHNRRDGLDVAADRHDEESEPTTHDEEHEDPHLWLDPVRFATTVDQVTARLSKKDPKHRADFERRANRVKADLTTLDTEYQTGLATCEIRTFIVSHQAFGYFAERYQLTQLSISGLDPEAEPTPARLTELADTARNENIRVIFFETLVSSAVAETLARNVGAETAVLDPIEGLRPGVKTDYPQLMRANLSELRTALRCT